MIELTIIDAVNYSKWKSNRERKIKKEKNQIYILSQCEAFEILILMKLIKTHEIIIQKSF